jgi:exopolysaccharide biosynthesis polyprenyl glycosylphosphotransferase
MLARMQAASLGSTLSSGRDRDLRYWSDVPKRNNVLHHRLTVESQNSSLTMTEAPYSVDQISRVDSRMVAATMAALDLSGCITVSFAIRHGLVVPSIGLPYPVLAWLVMQVALWLACASAMSLYNQSALRSGSLQLLPALTTTCLAFLPSLGSGELADVGGKMLSPVLIAFLCQLAVVILLRGTWGIVLGALLRRGSCLERVAILATSSSSARIISAFLEHRTRGKLRVVVSAVIPRPSDETVLLWLESVVRSYGIDRILLADDGGDKQRLHETIVALGSYGDKITIIRESGLAYRLGGQPSDLPRLSEHAPPLSPRQLFCKRVFDICVGAMALIALFPLLLLLAALIRLDSKGPLLFRQTRQGLDGRLFKIIKFRTMYGHLADLDCTMQTTRSDPRVTRVGRILRTTSLDELPQLVNVLRGEMSIIGPRPHALGMHVEGKLVMQSIEGYESRLRVKPGITGWAQINGSRGEVRATKALRQRLALDSHYIENWSLKTDAKILCRTAILVFRDKHAF